MKNNPFGNILYLRNCSRVLKTKFIFLQRRIQAIYAANFITTLGTWLDLKITTI